MSRNPSQYARNLARLSARIFGEPLPERAKQSQHVTNYLSKLPYYKNREFTHWYPPIKDTTDLMRTLRTLGLFVDDHLDFKEEMERQRILRGKGKKRNRS